MSRVPLGSDGGAWAQDPETHNATAFVPQGIGADLIATIEGFAREDVDAFALESQKEIFARLECAKRIGLTLTDTMLMVPFKSVTAVIGVTDAPTCTYVKCRGCANTDCEFREI